MAAADRLVTWATVQARLDLADAQETLTTRYIDVASVRANQHTGRELAARDATVALDGTGTTMLFLPQYPVNSITSVKIDSSRTFGSTAAVTNYYTDDDGILIRDCGWPYGKRNVQVVGNFGYETTPDDLEESIIQLVGYWLDSPNISFLNPQEGAAGGGYQTNYVGVMDLPFQVRNVWDMYRAVRF